MSFNIALMYQCLRDFDFSRLLVEGMHWKPPINRKQIAIDEHHMRREIARIDGVPVLEITAAHGKIVEPWVRAALHGELSYLFRNSLLLFLDEGRTQSVWYWIKREYDQSYTREVHYNRGQPEYPFLNTLSTIISDIKDAEKPRRERQTEDYRSVTERYSRIFADPRTQLAKQIIGIEESRDLSLFATVIFCRLFLLYFLQRRGFLNNSDSNYLEERLHQCGEDNYYRCFLRPLFFEGLGHPARSEHTQKLFSDVPYLNGPMFRLHAIELKYPDSSIPNGAFEELFASFSGYEWRIVNIFTGTDNEITPDVLSDIFEGWFNQQSGPGSSPPEITSYLCRQTIHQWLVEKVNQQIAGRKPFTSLEDVLEEADNTICRYLLLEALPSLSILDPACGSGKFLLAALNTVALIYSSLLRKVEAFHDDEVERWVQDIQGRYSNLNYALKAMIITKNLYGVDISEEAIVIAQLMLYLNLTASPMDIHELQPLPDENMHLSTGNSLIGELRAHDVWSEKPQSAAFYNEMLYTKLREARPRGTRIRVRQESDISIEEIEQLRPFHWCYHFPYIMNEHGGFDIIITAPPWRTDKSRTLSEAERLFYQITFHYENRSITSAINLDKLFVERSCDLLSEHGCCSMMIPANIATDVTASPLRRFLFKETQVTGLYCFENSKHLFTGTHSRHEIALLSFMKGRSTNIFPVAFSDGTVEEIHSFPAQHAVFLTTKFLRDFSPESLTIGRFRTQTDVDICEKMLQFPRLGTLSRDGWNLKFAPGVALHTFSSGAIIGEGPGPDRFMVYEGKMIHQFTHSASSPHYWIDSKTAKQQQRGTYSRPARIVDLWETSGFHGYHLAYRSVTSRTNERTLIATVLPPDTMIAETLHFIASPLESDSLLFLAGLFNSFIADFFVRFHVSHHVSSSTISHLPVPYIIKRDTIFSAIVSRVASLICTTEEFKDLWESALEDSWSEKKVATVFAQRERLRAELDGLIAHLYTVTEEELVHVLSTFPLVADPVKVAVQNAYRDVERGLIV